MKTINIKTIRIDGGTQSRVEINNEIVTEYAEAIKAGAEFPAVVVFNDGVDNWLADGFHRFHAHRQAGKTSIAVDVRQGTARDAVLHSLGANGTHGLNRTNADKRKAVQTMLADSEWATWSDRKIAEACGVGHPFVAAIRKPEVAEKQQANRDSSATKKTKKVESDSTDSEKTKPAPASPAPSVPEAIAPSAPIIAPEDEYTPMDAAQDQIQELQSMLAVANMGDVAPEAKEHAKNLIAELQEENRKLRANLKAVTTSRDTLMNELAMVKRQCISLQAKLKKAA